METRHYYLSLMLRNTTKANNAVRIKRQKYQEERRGSEPNNILPESVTLEHSLEMTIPCTHVLPGAHVLSHGEFRRSSPQILKAGTGMLSPLPR